MIMEEGSEIFNLATWDINKHKNEPKRDLQNTPYDIASVNNNLAFGLDST